MDAVTLLFNTIWRQINSYPVSSTVKDTALDIRSGKSFKALPGHALQEINEMIDNAMQTQWKTANPNTERLSDVRQRMSALGNSIANYKSGTVVQTIDSLIQRNVAPYAANTENGMTMGMGLNPLYISPGEAAVIYSSKGIPELIIEKKSHSPLLNGISIKNSHLSPKQIDKIQDDIGRYQFDMNIANAIRDSLVYGGTLIFPHFKNDSPATLWMDIGQLIRFGVLGKNTITRFTTLDRWNVVFTPDWNPVHLGFNDPPYYFIPFLGSVIAGQRCARVVTSPPAGYWGTLLTLGWGVSDIPGWIEAVYNYESVIAAVPFMIKQMSLLARVWDSSGMGAMDGLFLMDDEAAKATIRNRGTGPETIVNLDVMGDLKAINRDFAHVSELIRLLRQDVGAKARYPEELIWSSERGAFSSGDTTDSAWEKQTENVRYTHIKVGAQLKRLAMIFVINSLGPTQEVLKALPFTSIEFDNPKLTNAKDKSAVAKNISEASFSDVASGMPLYMATDKASQLSDKEFKLSAEFMSELKQRQNEADEFDKKQRYLELQEMRANIELIKAKTKAAKNPPASGASGGSGEASVKTKSKSKDTGEGHSYGDKLEQKKHETVGQNRGKTGIARAQGKKL